RHRRRRAARLYGRNHAGRLTLEPPQGGGLLLAEQLADAVPADGAEEGQPAVLAVEREVQRYRLPLDVLRGYEAPVARVEALVTVVAEHEILARWHDDRTPVITRRAVARGIDVTRQVIALPVHPRVRAIT